MVYRLQQKSVIASWAFRQGPTLAKHLFDAINKLLIRTRNDEIDLRKQIRGPVAHNTSCRPHVPWRISAARGNLQL